MREPLLHFFILGAMLFAFYQILNDSTLAENEIVLSQGGVENMALAFEKTWQRPPTDEEQQNLIDAWIREEIMYREGVAIGFDLDDPVIRRRVAQKMSFVADGLVPDAPSEVDMQAWLDSHKDKYRLPPRYTFRQVYFDPQRHGDQLEIILEAAQAQLQNPSSQELPGDSTLLPTIVELASSIEIARNFGEEFSASLAGLEVGSWQGPVRSGYGLHFVEILQREESRDPSLDEVKVAVERDLLNKQSQDINEAFYAALRERYVIRIETPSTEVNE